MCTCMNGAAMFLKSIWSSKKDRMKAMECVGTLDLITHWSRVRRSIDFISI